MLELDHPDIERAMRTGYVHRVKENPVCPVCGNELGTDDWVFVKNNKVLGCEYCIDVLYSYELEEAGC